MNNQRIVDPLDAAIHAVSKARAKLIAVGEQLNAAPDQPTEEELCLHAHLLHAWQRSALELRKMLSDPLLSPATSMEPEG